MVELVDDDADWTWVLERTCGECGFAVADLDPAEVPALMRSNAREWVDLLTGGDQVAVRTRPDRWSVLEYACHVRDVFDVYDRRLALMLEQDSPHYDNWDQDETARVERYGEQDPEVVAGELLGAAESLARRFESVQGEQWDRTGHRSDGAEFTVRSFARYFIHDPVHHIWDVTGDEARQ